MRGRVGVNGLRRHYSSNKRNGTCTEHYAKAAGKNIRYCLQQLQVAGLVGKITVENDDGTNSIIGKALTKKGTTDMDRIASQIAKENKKTV
jgi:ribosomal protein S19E (S16A)